MHRPLLARFYDIALYPAERLGVRLRLFRSPVREVSCGLAETIKHACLADYEFFEYLEENINKVVSKGEAILDPEVCEYIAMKNCQIKYRVVKEDEKESNFRQILNLGHTAGRALEILGEIGRAS